VTDAGVPSCLADCLARLDERGGAAAVRPLRQVGTVADVLGLTLRVRDLAVPVGSLVSVAGRDALAPVAAEVIGFADGLTLLMPLGPVDGVRRGDVASCILQNQRVPVGRGLLGRVIDGRGQPIDGKGPLDAETRVALHRTPPDPIRRRRVTQPLATGVRAIDGFLTCGRGQRVGIFSGTGVGKSVLLGMIARHTAADVNVVALIGERGREVRDFLERDLGAEGLARSVVVVSTSYDPPPLRVKAGFVAAALAEHFRDLGLEVLFLMDSVTRIAMAQREIGLSAGEPPATRGYPPSVFALLPQLVERAGCSTRGAITGFYNVLVEGDDLDEPVSDAARGVLDGHVRLDRKLAARQHYPAISVLESVSRLMVDVAGPEHRQAAAALLSLLAALREAEDLVAIGAYVKGSDPQVDLALEMRPAIDGFLRQGVEEHSTFEATLRALMDLAATAGRTAETLAAGRAAAARRLRQAALNAGGTGR
jgi:flagellum-specific ATP synthase